MSVHNLPSAFGNNNLAFGYDMYNEKSYKGEPTVNHHKGPYRITGTYSPGWDTINGWHNGAVTATSYDGTDVTGFTNFGVNDPYKGLHAYLTWDPDIRKIVTIIDNRGDDGYPGRWKAHYTGLGDTPANYGWGYGTQVTVSCLMWSEVAGGGLNPGLYHRRNDVGYYDFESAIGFLGVSRANTWERVSTTYTVTSNWTLTSGVSFYGYGSTATMTKCTDWQVETRGYATKFTPAGLPRTTTNNFEDLSSSKIPITSSNLVYSSNGTFSFNGSSSRILSTSPTTINYANGGTFEMVFRSTDIATPRAQGYMQHNQDLTAGYINFYSAQNRMRWEVIGNGTVGPYGWYGDITLSNNTWYHVVGTFTNTGVCSLYINGVLDKSVTQTSYPRGNITATIVIGEYAGYMSGNIDMAKIYNKALSADEVRLNFQSIRNKYGI